MGSKIRVLNDDTINKIAAGEVIENPSSVVKELVDNSLDAGATEIVIEIGSGGRQLIRISDNGCGMDADDALLCLERHGTSKIKSIDDLHSVMTMGFRGEAIPSIASISKFILITTPVEKNAAAPNEGTMVVVEGGRLASCTKAVRSPGTTIEVKSLFYNVPVRKKFQKSPAYDTGEIVKIISSLALANPAINFQLISDQQVLIKTHSGSHESFKERVASILGDQFLENSIDIDCQFAPYKIWGVIGSPQNHRVNRKSQYLFINKRPVFSPLVSLAVKEGFGTLLPPNKHPIFCLHLEMISSLVDVNVHPQKKEVRLRQEGMLKHVIIEAVSKALQKKAPMKAHLSSEEHQFRPSLEFMAVESNHDHYVSNVKITPAFDFRQDAVVYASVTNDEKPLPKLQKNEEDVEATPFLFQHSTANTMELPKIVLILPGYLVVNPGNKQHGQDPYYHNLCLIDQRRAHHRIIFEQLSIDRASQNYSQKLVVPFSLEFSPQEKLILSEYLNVIQKLGFHLQEFGKNSYLIDAVPHDFKENEPGKAIKELLEALREGGSGRSQVLEKEKILAQQASQYLIKRKSRLSLIEAQELLERLFKCQTPYQCPYGKPTHLFITPEEINKYF